MVEYNHDEERLARIEQMVERLQREQTAQAYVKAMFHPGRIFSFPLDAEIVAQIPDDLTSDVPTSAQDLADLKHPAWQLPDPSTD